MMMNNCCGPEVQLSRKGQKLMLALRFVIFIEFCLAVIAITAGRYFDGAIFIIMTLIGVCVASNLQRSSMLMACYFIFHLIQAIWGTLYMILYLADVRVYPTPSQQWRKILLNISIYGLVAIFYIGSIISYMIFNEVRHIIYGQRTEAMNGGGAGGDYHGGDAGGGGGHAIGGRRGENIDDLESGRSKKEKKEEKKSAFSGKGQAVGGGGARAENPWKTGGPPRRAANN